VDRDGNFASDFTEISWSVEKTPLNIAPTANAGNNVSITLPVNSVNLSGSGTDSDGVVTSYLWTQQAGATATITNGTTPEPTISNLTEGSFTFRLTVTDEGGATGLDEVTIIVFPATGLSWNSYDIEMQPTQATQGLVNSTDSSTMAAMSFFQSTNDGGVNRAALLSVYNPGSHSNSLTSVKTFWATAANSYTYAGKSTIARGTELGEDNPPSPLGVSDLQMHPPNSNKLIVSAFAVPVPGNYSISNVGVRRVSAASGTTRLKIFNDNKTIVLNLQTVSFQDWALHSGVIELGTLSPGDSIYFAIDRDANYASDFTELTWRVNQNTIAGRIKTDDDLASNFYDEATSIKLYPNPVKNIIHIDGLAKETEVKIFSSMGTLMQANKVDNRNNTIQLDQQKFHSGFYIMLLKNDNMVEAHKFIKE
jgi:hypothetical protein